MWYQETMMTASHLHGLKEPSPPTACPMASWNALTQQKLSCVHAMAMNMLLLKGRPKCWPHLTYTQHLEGSRLLTWSIMTRYLFYHPYLHHRILQPFLPLRALQRAFILTWLSFSQPCHLVRPSILLVLLWATMILVRGKMFVQKIYFSLWTCVALARLLHHSILSLLPIKKCIIQFMLTKSLQANMCSLVSDMSVAVVVNLVSLQPRPMCFLLCLPFSPQSRTPHLVISLLVSKKSITACGILIQIQENLKIFN